MRITYLIAPALTDQAGQCWIVAREDWDTSKNATVDYREDYRPWKQVGLMNSRGFLVCLDAPAHVVEDFRNDQPLAAGLTYTFDLSEAELENLKLRDMLQRIVDDADAAQGYRAISKSLIEEVRQLLSPEKS